MTKRILSISAFLAFVLPSLAYCADDVCRDITGLYELNFGKMEMIQDGCEGVVKIKRIITSNRGKVSQMDYVLDGVKKVTDDKLFSSTDSWKQNQWVRDLYTYQDGQITGHQVHIYFLNENRDLVFRVPSTKNPDKIYKRLSD